MKRILLILAFLLSNTLCCMITVDPDYVIYPENFYHFPLMYSSHEGFSVDLGGMLIQISNRYVPEELHKIGFGELYFKLGKMWIAKYHCHETLVSKVLDRNGSYKIMYDINGPQEEIRNAIVTSMPITRKLELYFPERNKLGIRIV